MYERRPLPLLARAGEKGTLPVPLVGPLREEGLHLLARLPAGRRRNRQGAEEAGGGMRALRSRQLQPRLGLPVLARPQAHLRAQGGAEAREMIRGGAGDTRSPRPRSHGGRADTPQEAQTLRTLRLISSAFDEARLTLGRLGFGQGGGRLGSLRLGGLLLGGARGADLRNVLERAHLNLGALLGRPPRRPLARGLVGLALLRRACI
mmetsp:Transcript_21369/g.72379  ORF Transcript_21369/g.72379 Transcript_21369/m.72379 type:complete len:206 (-) Transcript_21369:894-1511(-)